MRTSLCAVFVLTLLLAPSVFSARHIGRSHSNHHHSHKHHTTPKAIDGAMAAKPESYGGGKSIRHRRRRPDTVQIAGSRLPDCSHACGSCTPCRLVMVSFVCASLAESETCPMAYKCMCNSKSYPVP